VTGVARQTSTASGPTRGPQRRGYLRRARRRGAGHADADRHRHPADGDADPRGYADADDHAHGLAAAVDYTIATGTATIVPGVDDTGNHCDDCLSTIALPFPFRLYDQTFTSADVSSDGQLDLQAGDSGYLKHLPA